jgi:hypothetical protein
MSLSAPRLELLIKAAFAASGAPPSAALNSLSSMLASAIVAEIAQATVVPLPGLTAPPGGGPVTGVGSLT